MQLGLCAKILDELSSHASNRVDLFKFIVANFFDKPIVGWQGIEKGQSQPV